MDITTLKNQIQTESTPEGTAVVIGFCNALLLFRQYDAAADLAQLNQLIDDAKAVLQADYLAKHEKVYDSFLTKKAKEKANVKYMEKLNERLDTIQRLSVKETVKNYWSWFQRPRGKITAIKALLRQQGVA